MRKKTEFPETEEVLFMQDSIPQNIGWALQRTYEFVRMMSYYRCAMMSVETKLNVLNEEFSLRFDRQPINSIKTRLKNPLSIQEKLIRKNLPLTVESIETNLHDIAGIRVICSFVDDVYAIADTLLKQDDTEIRKLNMSHIRSTNTKPEEILRHELFRRGYRYRKNDKRLPGKPDIVLPKYRTVVFVNGCFWHMHTECGKFHWPSTNVEYWKKKISNNVVRDEYVQRTNNINKLAMLSHR